MPTIKDVLIATAEQVRRLQGDQPTPPPDAFDMAALPYGALPGGNKGGFETCPFCGKPPTETGNNVMPRAFLFRDKLSAQEYHLSGLCQACQDTTFKAEEA
jgi:hypothetical protein